MRAYSWLYLVGLAHGYLLGRLRPWVVLGDWLERQDDDPPVWRQVYLVPLLWIRFPRTIPFTIKWWCGWRPGPRSPIRPSR